jgi:hypothetical protein
MENTISTADRNAGAGDPDIDIITRISTLAGSPRSSGRSYRRPGQNTRAESGQSRRIYKVYRNGQCNTTRHEGIRLQDAGICEPLSHANEPETIVSCSLSRSKWDADRIKYHHVSRDFHRVLH